MRGICTPVLLLVMSAGMAHADVRIDRRILTRVSGTAALAAAGATEMHRSVIVKGDRMMTVTKARGLELGRLVDFKEEKIYTIDIGRRSYSVETFAEIRAEATRLTRESIDRDAADTAADRPSAQDVIEAEAMRRELSKRQAAMTRKATGQRKTVNGFDAQELVTTMNLGSLPMIVTEWIAVDFPDTSEIQTFQRREANLQRAAGSPETDTYMLPVAGVPMSNGPMASAQFDDSIKGTAVLTVTSIGSAEATKEPDAQTTGEEPKKKSRFGSIGGAIAQTALGRLPGGGSRTSEREPEREERVTGSWTQDEILKVSTVVSDDEVSIPAGYKENRRRR
jgi:hypothetical protein